jgi:hypothetical protein
VAGLGHWLIGSVDWYIVGALLLGSLPGISIGSYLATRISDRFLLPALECAPDGGQFAGWELTGAAGLSEDESHGQAPHP